MCRLPHLISLLLLITLTPASSQAGSHEDTYQLSTPSDTSRDDNSDLQLLASLLNMQRPNLGDLMIYNRMNPEKYLEGSNRDVWDFTNLDDVSLEILARQLTNALEENRRSQDLTYKEDPSDKDQNRHLKTRLQEFDTTLLNEDMKNEDGEVKSRTPRRVNIPQQSVESRREDNCRTGRLDWPPCNLFSSPWNGPVHSQLTRQEQPRSSEITSPSGDGMEGDGGRVIEESYDDGEKVDDTDKELHRKKRETNSDENEENVSNRLDSQIGDDSMPLVKRAADFHSWGGKRAKGITGMNKKLPWNTKRLPEFNSWGGKRATAFNSWGGKRAPGFNSWGGKRAPEFNSWGGKRAPEFNSWGGKRAPAFNSWGGKRAPGFNSWGGKRAPEFNSWGGKRAPEFNSWGGKRAPEFNSWGGKRAPEFNSWGGKRATAFNSWGGKRATSFNSWGGKRAPAFNSWGGKRAPEFNSWGGKRAAEFDSWDSKQAPALDSWDDRKSIETLKQLLENDTKNELERGIEEYTSESAVLDDTDDAYLSTDHITEKRGASPSVRTMAKPPTRAVRSRTVEFYPWGGKRSNSLIDNERQSKE